MADKILDYDTLYWKRFTCDCFHHIMDVTIEFTDNKKRLVMCEIDHSFHTVKMPVWERIRAAFAILTGHRYQYHDFILRPDDIKELMELLEKGLVE